MNIKDLQTWVADDWKYRSDTVPTTEQQMLFIVEELGEVAEAIRKNNGNKKRHEGEVDLGSEIADLVISILTLANTYNVDVESELNQFKARLEQRR